MGNQSKWTFQLIPYIDSSLKVLHDEVDFYNLISHRTWLFQNLFERFQTRRIYAKFAEAKQLRM